MEVFCGMILTGLVLQNHNRIFGLNEKSKEVIAQASDDTDYGYRRYENRIALTFDDGPAAETTEELLEGLKERGVHATFFFIGESAQKHPEIVQKAQQEGHLIGNHTYSHVQLENCSIEAARREIVQTNEVMEQITGVIPKYIRPPYGDYSNQLLSEVNMIPVLWSIDPKDWERTDVSNMVREIVSDAKDGDIILFHDIYKTSVVAALEVVDILQDRGYVFVTVDELLLD